MRDKVRRWRYVDCAVGKVERSALKKCLMTSETTRHYNETNDPRRASILHTEHIEHIEREHPLSKYIPSCQPGLDKGPTVILFLQRKSIDRLMGLGWKHDQRRPRLQQQRTAAANEVLHATGKTQIRICLSLASN
jgi:hypothetical protein